MRRSSPPSSGALTATWRSPTWCARRLVLDLSRVSSANDVGRRMLREGVRRLEVDGHDVRVEDPSGVLHD